MIFGSTYSFQGVIAYAYVTCLCTMQGARVRQTNWPKSGLQQRRSSGDGYGAGNQSSGTERGRICSKSTWWCAKFTTTFDTGVTTSCYNYCNHWRQLSRWMLLWELLYLLQNMLHPRLLLESLQMYTMYTKRPLLLLFRWLIWLVPMLPRSNAKTEVSKRHVTLTIAFSHT